MKDDPEPAWKDVKSIIEVPIEKVCVLGEGCESGKPSVGVRFDIGDKTYVGQLTMNMIESIAAACRGTYERTLRGNKGGEHQTKTE